MGSIDYYSPDGSSSIRSVQVVDYDRKSAKFYVESEDGKVKAWRSRLFISLETDKQ